MLENEFDSVTELSRVRLPLSAGLGRFKNRLGALGLCRVELGRDLGHAWVREGKARLGQWLGLDPRPMEIGKRLFIYSIFLEIKLFRFKFGFKLRTTSIHKIKYKSTSSHNKICSRC
jgi:hypothetical protein